MSEAEHAAIAAKAAMAGMTISGFVRRRALQGSESPNAVVVDTKELQRIYRDLRRVGGNLNQVCRWLNTHSSSSQVLEDELRKALATTSEASEEVTSFISLARERV